MQATTMTPSSELMQKYSAHEPTWLQEKRKQAFALFEKKEQEQYKYGLGVFAPLPIDLNEVAVSKTLLAPTQVKGIQLMSLTEALSDEHLKASIQQHYSTILPITKKEDALHYAFADTLVIVNEEDATLNLTFLIEQFAAQHLFIIVKENTTLTIKEHVSGSGFRTAKVEAVVNNNASLHYTTIQHMGKGQHLSAKKAVVKDHAQVYWQEVTFGSDHAKAEIISALQGKHAESHTNSVFFGIHHQVFDLHTTAVHAAPHTTSSIKSKGCLDHKAKAIYKGLIDVQESAPDSKGDQKEDTLLLSEDAEADAMPDLIIHNDEVQCHHGASVGNLDPKTLFYLQSRGLTEEQAKKLLVSGFFADVEDKHIQQLVQERLA